MEIAVFPELMRELNEPKHRWYLAYAWNKLSIDDGILFTKNSNTYVYCYLDYGSRQKAITGWWDLGTISQFEPVPGKFQADGRCNHLPSAHLPSGSLVSLWLFFLTAVRKAIHLAFFAGQKGSAICGGKATAPGLSVLRMHLPPTSALQG